MYEEGMFKLACTKSILVNAKAQTRSLRKKAMEAMLSSINRYNVDLVCEDLFQHLKCYISFRQNIRQLIGSCWKG